MVHRRPDQAADDLRCVTAMANAPPTDLVPVMQQYGSVYLFRWKQYVRVLYSDAKYLEWPRHMVDDFTEITGKAGIDVPPHEWAD